MDESTKRCVTCHEERPLIAFNVRRQSKDGLQDRCRECSRAWYLANREEHIRNVGARTARMRRTYRQRIGEYLRDHPCIDCGETDLACLDFDHRDRATKAGGVGQLAGQLVAWSRVEAEIAKCDVRCANCHRRRTARQMGWWSAADEQPVDELVLARLGVIPARRPAPPCLIARGVWRLNVAR